MPRRTLPGLLLLVLATPLFAQLSVQITEFQAVNVAGVVDDENSHQPWIEIWNPNVSSSSTPNGTVVNLTGYRLTSNNGATSWQFPDVRIMPDERMVVWVSGKNHVTLSAPLHTGTGFTIPAAGGTVQLRNASNGVISQITYPAQAADESYGRDEWDTATVATQVGRYTSPTPGDRNNYSGGGVSGKVLFDKTSQAFTGTFTVSLAQVNPTAGAAIYYTLDGTVPTTASSQYSTPFSLAATSPVGGDTASPEWREDIERAVLAAT